MIVLMIVLITGTKMKKLLFLLLLPILAQAQLSRPALISYIDANIYNNSTHQITGLILNNTLKQLANSNTNTITDISGTTNYVPKFTSTTTLGNSLIFDSTSTWTVAKNLRIDGLKIPTGAGAAKVWTSDANGLGSWATAASSSLTGATGDLISFSATDTKSNISAGATAGAFLRNVGASTIPAWSTLILPNTGTANYIPYYTSTNTLGESANLKFNSGYLEINTATSNAVLYATLAGSAKGLIGQDGGSFYFSSYNPNALAFYTNGGGKLAMWITQNSSNVGFGHASPTASVHIKAGTATASTAPLKFTSGTLLTTPEAGAVEFLTDKLYATITTGTARKEFTLNDAALTSTYLPIATTNGRLTNSIYTSDLANLYIPYGGGGYGFQDYGIAGGDGTYGLLAFGGSGDNTSVFLHQMQG
jgi:hypothetical protein